MAAASSDVSVVVVHPAVRALQGVMSELALNGIDATRDAGAFYPQPVGVLVGIPALVKRGQATYTYEVPVSIVSGDPVNSDVIVDRMCSLADDVAIVLETYAYRPGSYRSGVNAEPLPSLELTVTVTVTETEE